MFWLEDAPLFADAGLRERFYDAVASPENREKSIGLEITEATVTALQGEFNLEASLTPDKVALRSPRYSPLSNRPSKRGARERDRDKIQKTSNTGSS